MVLLQCWKGLILYVKVFGLGRVRAFLPLPELGLKKKTRPYYLSSKSASQPDQTTGRTSRALSRPGPICSLTSTRDTYGPIKWCMLHQQLVGLSYGLWRLEHVTHLEVTWLIEVLVLLLMVFGSGWKLAKKCIMCYSEEELVDHLFMYC